MQRRLKVREENNEFTISKKCIHGHKNGGSICIKCATEEALKTLNDIREEVKQLRLMAESDKKYVRYDKIEALIEELKIYIYSVNQEIFAWEGMTGNVTMLARVILETLGMDGGKR